MRMSWVGVGAGALAALLLTASGPLLAAEAQGAKTVAEQLNERTKTPPPAQAQDDHGLSDSAVRVMSGYAWAILPDQVQGPDGTTQKIDKSDPKKFFIPISDARTVIRAAMRSAYAQICDLPDLERQNYMTLMQGEQNRGVWSKQQMQFINALHTFSVSYFTGSLKITANDPNKAKNGGQAAGGQNAGAGKAAANATQGDDSGFDPKKPTCTPEKKKAVTEAILAFVNASKQSEAPVATQVKPESSGAN